MNRKELMRVTPESVGISSRGIGKYIDALEASGTELHGLMIIRHGKVAAEGWWAPYAPGIRHGCQSLTKTYAATAVGFAFDEGLLRLEDRITDILHRYVPENPGENLKKMTVRDVLCMGCGMESMPSLCEKDWIREFLKVPVVHEPGTAFFYNSIGSSILGAIIRELTGKGLIEYLKPRLFDAIGIDASNLKCIRHKDGLEFGGGGLFSTTEDNARLGMLYLQNGIWEGKQILSKEWVRLATMPQNDSSEDPGIPDCKLGYGFQMWMCRPSGVYRFDGAFGQYTIVFPDLDMVVAINETAPLAKDTQAVLDITWDYLLPEVSAPLPANDKEYIALRRRMEGLALPKPKFRPFSPIIDSINGKAYDLEDNSESLFPTVYLHWGDMSKTGIERIALNFSSTVCELVWDEGGVQNSIRIGLDGNARYNENVTDKIEPDILLASGAWTDANVFETDIRFLETCFKKRMTFTFEGDRLELRIHENIRNIGLVQINEDTVINGRSAGDVQCRS